MFLTEYETTLVLRPNITGDTIEATLDKIRNTVNAGGKLLAINHWGKKRLAYEIAKQTRGIYVHTHYLGGGQIVAEIERNLRLSEDVIRFLTVKVADEVTPDGRETQDYVAPVYQAGDDTVDDEPLADLRGDHRHDRDDDDADVEVTDDVDEGQE